MPSDPKWLSYVTAWRASGLTSTAFCAGKGLSVSTLRYWAKRARDAGQAPADVRIAKVVAAAPSDEDSAIVLEVGQVRIAVRRGFDREVLRDVLTTLASLSS